MLGNMLNDLAEAIRRWTEKKMVAVVTALLPCFSAGSVVVLCHPSVKWLISPVWGFHPRHHVAGDVRELSVATLRYSLYDDPVPTLDPAKLPYCFLM